jgi:hypothetical protein
MTRPAAASTADDARPYLLIAGAAMLLALLIRLPGIADHSIWIDELIYLREARMPRLYDAVLQRTMMHHPPLAAVFLWLEGQLIDPSLVTLRVTCAVLGALTAFVWTFVARELARAVTDDRAAILWGAAMGGVAFAVAPAQIFHGRNAHAYAGTFLIAATQLWSFLTLRRTTMPSWPRTLAHAVLAVAHVYAHFIGLAFFVIENLVTVVNPRRRAAGLRWFAPQTLAALAVAPLLADLRTSAATYSAAGAGAALGPDFVLNVIKGFHGTQYLDLQVAPFPIAIGPLTLMMGGGSLLLGVMALIGLGAALRNGWRRHDDAMWAYAALAVGPFLAACVTLDGNRWKAFLLMEQLPWVGLVAWGAALGTTGLTTATAPWVGRALLTGVALIPLAWVGPARRHEVSPFKSAVAWLQDRQAAEPNPEPPVAIHLQHNFCLFAFHYSAENPACDVRKTIHPNWVTKPGADGLFAIEYNIEGMKTDGSAYRIFWDKADESLAGVGRFWLVLVDDRVVADPDRTRLARWAAPWKPITYKSFNSVELVELCRRSDPGCALSPPVTPPWPVRPTP